MGCWAGNAGQALLGTDAGAAAGAARSSSGGGDPPAPPPRPAPWVPARLQHANQHHVHSWGYVWVELWSAEQERSYFYNQARERGVATERER